MEWSLHFGHARPPTIDLHTSKTFGHEVFNYFLYECFRIYELKNIPAEFESAEELLVVILNEQNYALFTETVD